MKKVIKQQGFTLIEMIVSLGLFTVVAVTAVGALLAVISANQQLQAEQSVMTNLSFALDSMTREIRTGYGYVCAGTHHLNAPVSGLGQIFRDDSNDHDSMTATTTRDCSNALTQNYRGISFTEGGDSITGSDTRIMYYYDSGNEIIMRRVGNDNAQSIVSSGLDITDAQFIVTGSEALSENDTDTEQPTVTIYLEAESDDSPGKTYYLETTVTQRILDI